MRIILDRMVHKNETAVLKAFRKTREIDPQISLMELIEDTVKGYLSQGGVPDFSGPWTVVAIQGRSYRLIAFMENNQTRYWADEAISVEELLGREEPMHLLCLYGHMLRCPKRRKIRIANLAQGLTLPEPLRISTDIKQGAAFLCGLMALGLIIYTIVHYRATKILFIPSLLASLFFVLGTYFLLLTGRRVTFEGDTIAYRNHKNQVETFQVSQVDHVEWVEEGREVRFVFRFEQLERNFISLRFEDSLDVIVWALSKGIPIYSCT